MNILYSGKYRVIFFTIINLYFIVWIELFAKGNYMGKIFDCASDACDGSVDANDFTALQTGGCSISKLAFACGKCRRLHDCDGALRNAPDNSPLFFRDGKVVKDNSV